jgi:membrane protein implicated in regulation of membrane protease activity
MLLLDDIQFWYWWVAAVVFLAIEVFAPGAVFLWMGVAAAVVGAVLWVAPEITWEYQFLLFAVLAVSTAFGWRTYRRRYPPPESDHPTLNRRGMQYVGRVFTLAAPVINGQGKLSIDDTIWKVEGEDLPEGTQVRVVGVDGTILRIERAETA